MYYVLSFDIGIKNFSYCLIGQDRKIVLWNVCDISPRRNQTICKNVVELLDNINERIMSLDQEQDQEQEQQDQEQDQEEEKKEMKEKKDLKIYIVIEKQMSSKMKCVFSHIEMYYHFYNNMYPGRIVKIEKYHPRFKLQCYNFQEGDEELKPIRARKNSYTYNKNLGKQYCVRMIRRDQSDEIIGLFLGSKKKDDLSDSYLQGISYMDKNNL